MEVTNQFIDFWINHEKKYKDWQETVSVKINASDCYILTAGENSFYQNEFDILNRISGDTLIYHEFVKIDELSEADKFMVVHWHSKERQNLEKVLEKEENKHLRVTGIALDDKDKLRVLSDQYMGLVNRFEMDVDKREFYRKSSTVLETETWQIILKEANVEVLPSAVEKINCE